ncbi:MAG: ATP-dependent helicase [Chloroflexota bacterium]
MVPRPAQQAVLEYQAGRMAVSAVPGSGKTFTLSMLAAELIRQGHIDLEAGEHVLVVTYLNSSVETFRARIRQRLEEFDLPLAGYEIRTLHSLALEIVRLAQGGSLSAEDGPAVIDEAQALSLLSRATETWIDANPQLWRDLLSDARPQQLARWRELVEQTARSFIREAKNHRYAPETIARQVRLQLVAAKVDGLAALPELMATSDNLDGQLWLLLVMAGIYERYQAIIGRQGASDFDDLIWQAAELLVANQGLAADFRARWPYVLEDEAQDSVPLQETLLRALTGPDGNWVRVGDPNQAITSSFTAAHPRHFTAFMQLPDVRTLPLPNSGRCAPRIYGAANLLVNWVCSSHPVPEVRATAFRRQQILPTPPGDAQPNPPDTPSNLQIKVYRHREEDELPAIAQLASQYATHRPDQTVAILVPTNDLGHKLAGRLDRLEAPYDDLLRGGTRIREIASALRWLLQLLANPLDGRSFEEVYAALLDLDHPALSSSPNVDDDHMRVLLRSVHLPELLLYGASDQQRLAALPAGVAGTDDIAAISGYLAFVRSIFQYRSLPIDDLILSLSDELFAPRARNGQGASESDLALAYELAAAVRQWWDLQPDWRLPDLAGQLADVATGRRRLRLSGATSLGYKPEPGRITLATQHGAKGMEWDAVYLVGIDSRWIPGDLEGHFLGVEAMLGGDPAAEVSAQLHALMKGDAGIFPGRTATESAHIEVISERLRLLYVGITRARRYLHISRSKHASQRRRDYLAEPVAVMGVLYQYLKDTAAQEAA